MTVAELRARLERVPGDMRVVVDGYEGGYADLTPERMTVLVAVINGYAESPHYSPHAAETEAQERGLDRPREIVLLLSRNEIHSP